MEERDLRELESETTLRADVCIVGTGPAGLSLARELARADVRTCLLEAGGRRAEPRTQALYDFESTGHPWGRGELERRVRVLGGTSTTWTGRCAPLDPIDFRYRAWVPNSGWPITRAELDPYLVRAGALLGLGPHRYDESAWERFGVAPPRPAMDPTMLRTQLWQFSRRPSDPREPLRFAEDLLPLLRDARALTLVLHANVTRISTDDAAQAVTGVHASTLEGKRLVVRAPIVVLACGAIENARLLLASNELRREGLGNAHDRVGRYLMDHPAPALGTFEPHDAPAILERFGHYWLDDAQGRHVYVSGVALSERAQMERRLLNCTAYLLEDPREDAAMVALRRLSSWRGIPDARALLRDAFQVARGPAELVGAFMRRAAHRPEILPARTLTLIANPEQLPDPESRVMLSDQRDALGVPLARVHWRVHERERDTALATLEMLERELVRLGLPTPRRSPWTRGEADWRDAFDDMAHPTGTTRMHADAREGVVDPSCRVHGVSGLFVAGSSVFTTVGTANPTLTIVGLAMRLADHLRELVHATRTPELHTSGARERLRIGVVGAGSRAETVYLPLLAALADGFELVGLSSRSPERCAHLAERAGVPAFRSIVELVGQARPHLIVSCVSSSANAEVTRTLLTLGVPLLLETPLAWSLREGRSLVREIARARVPVGVAEQAPFLPIEELKATLRDAGVFGRIIAVHNDRHTFDYHGIAQLRRYLGPHRRPIEVSAIRGRWLLASPSGTATEQESWQTGAVRYDDGAILHHQLGAGVSPLLARIPGSLRIHGERASMIDDEVRLGVEDGGIGAGASAPNTQGGVRARSASRGGGAPPRKIATIVERTEHEVRGVPTLLRLSIMLPGMGALRWENPHRERPLEDEHIAVASHLEAMARATRGEGEPLYSAADALMDLEILRAMELSAELSGAPVTLPVNVALESLRIATSPSRLFDRVRTATR